MLLYLLFFANITTSDGRNDCDLMGEVVAIIVEVVAINPKLVCLIRRIRFDTFLLVHCGFKKKHIDKMEER